MQTPPLASPSAQATYPRAPRKPTATTSWYASSSPVPVLRDPRQLRISLTNSLLHESTSVSKASSKSGAASFAQLQLLPAKSVSELLVSPFAQSLLANKPHVPAPLASSFGFNAIDLKAVVHSHVPPNATRYDNCRRFFVTDRQFQPDGIASHVPSTIPKKRSRQIMLQDYFQRGHPTLQDFTAFPFTSSLQCRLQETSITLRSRPLLLCEFWEMEDSLPVLQSLLSSRIPLFPIVAPPVVGPSAEVPYRFVGILKRAMEGESIKHVFEEGLDKIIKGQQMYADAMGFEMAMDMGEETRLEVPDEVDSRHGLLDAMGMSNMGSSDGRVFEVVEGLVFQCFQVPARVRLGFE
ncbi:hypothetical protein BC830DRAFT_556895 [Chytriomyces sp. MP71]|nr:hypothetical protein BC830DRAFT_556895 [Chytriomyces sp. MP71]